MFWRTVEKRMAKRVMRRSCLNVEQLEDRSVPHGGVTQFSAGITPNAAPAGIVLGPDDNFWFAEFATSRIGRIGGVGSANTITEFTLPAGRGPLNLTVGPDGNIWFTENTGDRIGRFNPRAGSDAAVQASIVEFAVPGAGSQPNDIVSGPDGALWFTQTGSDQIGRITTAGVVTEFTIPVPNSAAFSDPEDIVSGPGGHLYFTDFGRDQIGRITLAGQITQFTLPVGRGPNQIVAAPDGNLYFTETASGRLGRLPANALNPGRPTSGTPPLEEFDFIARDSAPLGIALSGSDDIFFTLNNGNAIATFEAHLAQITATAAAGTINVFDIHLNPVRSFAAFEGYTGQVSVAIMDMAGAHSVGGATNGIPDVIVGAGPGAPAHVKVFDGSDNRLLASFFAFDPAFLGGVFVAADDVNGDGRNDLVVAAGTHVKVIDGTKLGQVQSNGQIADSALLASFFAFPFGTVGSITLAVGDLNRDGFADIIVGAGPGGPPHVKVIDGTKLGQLQPDGQIADSALLASFFAFGPNFRGGVTVAVGFNVSERNIIVGAGPGAGPHVKVVDVDLVGQVQPDGQIADSALLASFLAFGPGFTGGVRVAADDLTNADGVPEIFVSAGPGAGPHVKVLNGASLNQVQSNGTISPSSELASFLVGDPGFTGGVYIGADADHRDGTIFGPPGVNQPGGQGNSRRDVNDMYIFRSPTNPNNTVLVMDVSPFSTTGTPPVFEPGVIYDFRVVNRDILNATDDLVFRVTFGPPDAAAGGRQDVTVRALPAGRFAGTGGVIVKGFTGENTAVRGVGGAGAMFRAAEQDDPFFFDATGFSNLLNNAGGTAVSGVVAGAFPRGTGTVGPGGTPGYNAPNFFAGSNTLSIVLEIPSAQLLGPAGDAIGYWGRTEANGVQQDRMGRPAINTALIPPVPRGANFPAGATELNRQDVRTAFNLGHPRDDRANFTDDVTSVLAAYYPAGRPGGSPNTAQAAVVASLLLPDILVFRPSQSAGFFGDLATVNGTTFLAGGRKLSDDIISTELSVLTDDDLPAALGGGPNLPALVTQNVADDNGLSLMDGSLVGPGTALAGQQRASVFPYIAARNTAPTGVPGGNPAR